MSLIGFETDDDDITHWIFKNSLDNAPYFTYDGSLLDASGEPIWVKHLAQHDSVSNEEGLYLNLTPDSNHLVSGLCFSPGIKPYFIKTDTIGEELWNLKWPVGAGGVRGALCFFQ